MRALILCLVIGLATAIPTHARADFYVIVQVTNPQPALTQKEAVDIFMGRNRAFANGEFAQVFDLPRDVPGRDEFYHALTGLTQAQVNSYWSRLMFSGRNLPPQPLPSEAAMIETVRHNPRAIGWLTREPNDKQLRTLLILKE
jgi:hypothetical protein